MKLTDLVTDLSAPRSVSVTVSTYSPASRSVVSRAVYSASSGVVPSPSKKDITVCMSTGRRAERLRSAGMPWGVIS